MLALRKLFSRFAGDPAPESAITEEIASGVSVTSDELIQLRLRARDFKPGGQQQTMSAFGGEYRSQFRGRGMDYLESRGYQAGDDIRNMDWRVTARAGQPHVKLYQEERERPVVVMVDLSPGMFFGTRGAFKSVIAARAAALIGWAAVRNGDRIGALLFNGIHRELRPLGGQRGALRLIRELVRATDPRSGMAAPAHAGQLVEALQRLRRIARPGSLVYILSDFYGLDDDTRIHLQRLRQHNDVVACQIVDALEIQPLPAGRYGISDGQHSGILDTRTRARQEACTRYFKTQHEAVRELMGRSGIPLIQITTTDDVLECLRSESNVPIVSRSNPVGAAA
jgi:uncharacterized protein (DUF58 family)